VDAINAVSPRFDMLGFIVDAQYGRAGDLVNEKPILGDFTWLARYSDVWVVCGIGASDLRRRMVLRAAKLGVNFATLVHPEALLTKRISIGAGTVILARSSFSNNVRIGSHVHVSLHCTIGHDAVLDDFASLAPGCHISGNVHVMEGANLGTGANVIEKRTIGRWSIVGAGSTVVKDVPADSTVVGVPAQVIKERPSGWQEHES
jgi:sugar O-acyltransferase (sialic acid O-acetyltransferase NeuD family)